MKKAILTLFMLGVVGAVFAQIRVVGTVTSADDGSPLPFVSVAVKGTPVVVNTDGDGKYAITVPSGFNTLEFAFVGMISQAVEIGSRSVIDVALVSDVTNLEEVMVVAYGTAKKSSFSGSAVLVNAEELAQVPVASFDKSMQGKVAGMQVMSNSGQPGATTSFRIRGSGSLSDGANEPLYVIDGVATTSTDYSKIAESATSSSNILSSINPQDIESITVLKDAAAASLYGSRAANGVVVITTKSGRKGEGKVSFSAQYGISSLPKAYDMMSSAEYYQTLFTSYYQNPPATGIPAGETIGTWANRQTQGAITFNPYNMPYPYDDNGNLVAGAQTFVDTDWQDEVFKTGFTKDYNLSMSGGSDAVTYFISGGYYTQDGMTPAADYKRYSGKANINGKVKPWLTAGMNTTFSYSIQNTEVGGGAGASPLYNALLFPNGVPVYQMNADGTYILDANGNKQYNWTNPVSRDFNPLAIPNMDIWRTKTYRMLASAFMEFALMDGLTFRTTFSPDFISLYETRFWNMEHGNGPAYGGRSERHQTYDLTYTSVNTLNYTKTFAEVHSLSVMLGYEAWKSTREYASAQGTAFPFPGLIELDAAASPLSAQSNVEEEAMISYFGRAEYSYDDKYYASFSLRRDGSSVFGPDNRWGNFWSVGASWRLEQEDFIKAIDWIRSLKLRTSYGTSGNNSGLKRFQWQGLWSAGADYNYGALPGFAHTQLLNSNLGWESQAMFNVGVDFNLFGRIRGSVEYFYKTSTDLLYDFPLALSIGFDDVKMNMAKLRNSGVEIELGATAVQTRDFTWNIDFNFAAISDKIKEVVGDEQEISTTKKIWKPGYSQYEFYLPTWAGVDPTNGDPLWYRVENGVRTTTNDYSRATKEMQGRATPDCFGGLTNSFSYKDFNLSISLYYNIGGLVYDGLLSQILHEGNAAGTQMHKLDLNAWTPTNTQTDIPKYQNNNTNLSNSESTRFLYDATYVKIKNISLSYNLPRKWCRATGLLSEAKVYVSVDNLATWFKDDWQGYDDIDIFGIGGYNTNTTIPLPRTVSMGVNLTF